MKSANEGFKPCFIDYIWYVAENWSAREHTNLNGGMLLFAQLAVCRSYPRRSIDWIFFRPSVRHPDSCLLLCALNLLQAPIHSQAA